LEWAVQCVAKAGTVAIIGVYPKTDRFFPIGMAMNRNLTINMGNCNHRKYLPRLVDMVRNGTIKPSQIITQHKPLQAAVEAYKAFDTHQEGWMKVELQPV
jgi:threonine dehydrogenase-like Zn-dependent dehydrogenase